MTIALNFSINRDTITETHRAIKRFSRRTIEDFTSIHISVISIRTFKNRDNSFEIFKSLISNSSIRNRLRRIHNSIMILEIHRKSLYFPRVRVIFTRNHNSSNRISSLRNRELIIKINLRKYTSTSMIRSMTKSDS
jgi:hypothetical protein